LIAYRGDYERHVIYPTLHDLVLAGKLYERLDSLSRMDQPDREYMTEREQVTHVSSPEYSSPRRLSRRTSALARVRAKRYEDNSSVRALTTASHPIHGPGRSGLLVIEWLPIVLRASVERRRTLCQKLQG
jgi:hypothetical protein